MNNVADDKAAGAKNAESVEEVQATQNSENEKPVENSKEIDNDEKAVEDEKAAEDEEAVDEPGPPRRAPRTQPPPPRRPTRSWQNRVDELTAETGAVGLDLGARTKDHTDGTDEEEEAADIDANEKDIIEVVLDLHYSTLNELETRFREHHKQVLVGYRRSFEHAVAAGEVLIAGKSKLRTEKGHGHYRSWVEHLGVAHSTSQLYTRLARLINQMPKLRKQVVDMSLNTAAKFLKAARNRALNKHRLDYNYANGAIEEHVGALIDVLRQVREKVGEEEWQRWSDYADVAAVLKPFLNFPDPETEYLPKHWQQILEPVVQDPEDDGDDGDGDDDDDDADGD
jgi:hypothetical protein